MSQASEKPMCQAAGLLTIAAERQRRLASRRDEGRESAAEFAAALEPWRKMSLAQRVQDAYKFAAALDYHHPGLSPASYLAHPVRVAALALQLSGGPGDAPVLALLHNIFEVTTVRPAAVAAKFGGSMVAAIEVLTVDRSMTSRDYTQRYYAAIAAAPSWVRMVKVLDKLDNMFLLCLNPDAGIRSRYLQDVEEFVVPLADRDAPPLVVYLQALIADCRAIGFLDGKDL